jgi:hypothetical protein
MEIHRFRILTPDGGLSYDTFTVAARQPENIKADCLLVVDEATGKRLTVHETRLFPADVPAQYAPLPADAPRSVCLECGRVRGVVEDAVRCPRGEDEAPCDLLLARPE